MDITDTPIGQTIVAVDTFYIKTMFTRISQSQGRAELQDPTTGRVVMKINVDMSTGVQTPTWFDPSFWTVLVDGKVHHGPGANMKTAHWNPETRTINMTS